MISVAGAGYPAMVVRACSVDGCEGKYCARGFCARHYHLKRQDGSLLKLPPDRLCELDGCDRKYEARGLCVLHYQRFRKTGTTDAPPRRAIVRVLDRIVTFSDVEVRRLARETRTEGTCLVWTRARNPGGYGIFSLGKGNDCRTILAHRAAYQMARGPIPEGLVIDHLCRNRACVKVEHLEVVTQRENLRRGVALRHDPDQCPQGHAYAGENLYIGPDGDRQCRICKRARTQAWRARQRGTKSINRTGGDEKCTQES